MNNVYVLAGSNMGNRMAYLQQAAKVMEEQCGNIIKASSIYETAPWGFTEQPLFYNQAFIINTALPAEMFMRTLLNIEQYMGRERLFKMGARIIDLDILLYDDTVIQSELLTVPHPYMTQRRFVLTPLAEIAPDVVHPTTGKTILELLAECPDMLEVKPIYFERKL